MTGRDSKDNNINVVQKSFKKNPSVIEIDKKKCLYLYNIHVTFEYGCVWKTEGICKIITVKSFVKLGFSSCLYIIENNKNNYNQLYKNMIFKIKH
jgi:hypothetical protein